MASTMRERKPVGAAELTPFGKMTRKIRKEKGLLLRDMAKAVGVTSGFLSMVETGRKQVPNDLVSRLVGAFDLPNRAASELQRAAALSAREYKLRLQENPTRIDRELAESLQRNFAKMTPLKKKQILELLEEE